MHKVNQYITEAFFALLEKKEVDDISISELITKAGVCRASFYRNFMSLDDVLKQYLEDLFKRIEGDEAITPDSTYEHSKNTYEILYEERKRLKVMQKRGLLNALDDGYYALCSKQISKLHAYDHEYQIAFFAGASAFMVRTWIKNDFKETPDELCDMTSKILVKISSK